MFSKIAARFRDWRQAYRERLTEQLTARAASLIEDREYDLLFLYEEGFVRVRAIGHSIIQIHAEFENLVMRRLRAILKPGTCFAGNGSFQSMLTRLEYPFTLEPRASLVFAVAVCCANAERAIPKDTDRFRALRPASDDLRRFLERSRDADPLVAQAGVWALTDYYTGEQVKSRLVTEDSYGNTRQAISDAHVSQARWILDNLGIRHRL